MKVFKTALEEITLSAIPTLIKHSPTPFQISSCELKDSQFYISECCSSLTDIYKILIQIIPGLTVSPTVTDSVFVWVLPVV